MSAITIRLPDSLHEAAKISAKEEDVSEKLSALGAEKFLAERVKRGNRGKFLKVLKNSPDVAPEEFDEI